MGVIEESQLGKSAQYIDRYSPELLYPIARQTSRDSIGVKGELPFKGEDIWTCYEASWLNSDGMPQVAIAVFSIPCDSPNIIESKSFKLYLNSFNNERCSDWDTVQRTMQKDLSQAAGRDVKVTLKPLEQVQPIGLPEGSNLDTLQLSELVYEPDGGLLSIDDGHIVTEQLYSNLLRSNCPVTGQPDWASVVIAYKGPKIIPESLLRYIISFRNCQDFHEHCVERMFSDILKRCRCEELSVYARYTRRGGLDINPYRATSGFSSSAPDIRLVRQ